MKKLIYLFLALLIVACSGEDRGNDGDNNEDNNDNQSTDITAPIITIAGEDDISIVQGTPYTDDGATATDNVDGDLTSSIITSGTVDVNTVGSYTITYTVSDSAGNTATVSRQVTVVEYDDGNPNIGDIINGGIVFWVDPTDNSHGLMSASDISDDNRLTWSNEDCIGPYCGPYNILGNNYIGGGAENTDDIIDLLSYGGGTNYAAFYARNFNQGGFDDWYLPNEAELMEFANNWDIIKITLEDLEYSYLLNVINNEQLFWTSNGYGENSIDLATASWLYVPSITPELKTELIWVLPVRAY